MSFIYKSEKQYKALQKRGIELQKINKINKIFKTNEDEKKVIKLYREGLSCRQIAEKYNCSVFPVKKVLKNIPKRKATDYDTHFSKNQGFGETHHSWKGGYKSIYDRIRDLKSYWTWRNTILNRDNKECIECSYKENLEVHHKITLKSLIDNYCEKNKILVKNLTKLNLNDEYFYKLDNGITYCKTCHRNHHNKHGRK